MLYNKSISAENPTTNSPSHSVSNILCQKQHMDFVIFNMRKCMYKLLHKIYYSILKSSKSKALFTFTYEFIWCNQGSRHILVFMHDFHFVPTFFFIFLLLLFRKLHALLFSPEFLYKHIHTLVHCKLQICMPMPTMQQDK